jgi:hypothetical protein
MYLLKSNKIATLHLSKYDSEKYPLSFSSASAWIG